MKEEGARWLRLGYQQVRVRENYEIGPPRHLLHVMAKPLAYAARRISSFASSSPR